MSLTGRRCGLRETARRHTCSGFRARGCQADDLSHADHNSLYSVSLAALVMGMLNARNVWRAGDGIEFFQHRLDRR